MFFVYSREQISYETEHDNSWSTHAPNSKKSVRLRCPLLSLIRDTTQQKKSVNAEQRKQQTQRDQAQRRSLWL
jgi:hypothetical protein